ncbi:ribonuclease H-like domain-containing protein [Tanacetum coccineum]|uniref:Ribonuclease H-like domain-containing protein n=1 Tax=Tanacetum coccineum TaxID=301880 RepID=A0ABQ5F0S7_9ASTR
MVFYQMDTEEVSNRFVAPCFVNGLEVYNGEINLGVEENMISNEFAVKLCLEHKVKRGNKIVKKELIVALRGEIYFVKFIINLEEDDVEPGVIFGRSFLRLTKAITDFGAGTVTIYPDIDPFLEETEEEGKNNDDWDHLLDFNIDDVPLLAGGHLTQEEAAKEPIAIRMSQKFALLEEKRPIIETMAYNDKYKKILNEVNENALADTGSDINTMPFRIYEQLGRDDMKKVDKGITMVNHTQAEAMGILTNVLCHVGVTTLIAKFLILDIPIDRASPIVAGYRFLRMIGCIVNTPERLFSTFDGFCHQTFRAARSDVMRNAESDSDDEEEYHIKRNKFGAPIYGPKLAPYLSCNDLDERSLAIQTVSNPFQKINVWKKAVSFIGSLLVPLKQVNHKEHTIMRPGYQDPNAQDNMILWKKYCFHKFTMSFYYGKDVAEMQSLGNGYSLKDKNKAKTEHENGKSVKSQSQSQIQSQHVKDKDKTEEILNGPTRIHLMGRVSPLSLHL